MTMFKSTHHTDRKLVVKLGGSTLEQLNEDFYEKIKSFQEEGYQVVITHGGGPAISRALLEKNIESTSINGLRVTTDEMISIVQQTLIGEVNPHIVAQLNVAGIAAVGLNGFDGNLLQANYLNKEVYGHVGEVKNVRVDLIEHLLASGFVPVIACIGVTEQYQPLNINGDTVACQVAKAIQAQSLLLVTDVAGIRIQNEQVATASPEEIEKWIETGDIYGGMIPKVEGAMQVLKAGIPSVQIVNDKLEGTVIMQKELVR